MKPDDYAEALVEYPLSILTGTVAPAFGIRDALKAKGLANRLRAFQQGTEEHTYQPKGAVAQKVNQTIAENTPELVSDALRQYGEWSSENPTASLFADAALSTVGSGVGNSVKREIFRSAKTPAEIRARMDARYRVESGEDPAVVWQDTGFGRLPGTDRWVTEIDDSPMRFTGLVNGVTVGRAVKHPEFMDMYPDMNDWNFRKLWAHEADDGYFDNPNRTIAIKTANPGARGTLAHELQHYVQRREGLPTGGSPSKEFYEDLPVLKSLREAGPSDALSELEAIQQKRYQDYRNIQGEAIARLTQNRLDLSGSERREMYPFDPIYFRRLTGSDINDLTIDGKGVSKAIGPDQLRARYQEALDARGWSQELQDAFYPEGVPWHTKGQVRVADLFSPAELKMASRQVSGTGEIPDSMFDAFQNLSHDEAVDVLHELFAKDPDLVRNGVIASGALDSTTAFRFLDELQGPNLALAPHNKRAIEDFAPPPDNVRTLSQALRGSGDEVSKAFVFDNPDARGMTPDMYDFNQKPDYFRDRKGIDISNQEMPIEDYLREAANLNSIDSGVSAEEILASRRANTEQIKGIADALRSGTDFAAPYLDYRAGKEGQEGFHRTLAAELLGMKTVPVQIRKDYKP